jgi:hypothetical protein
VQALIDVMQATLPSELQNTRIIPADAWQVLAYASVNQVTLESVCGALPEAPSGNRLREVLMPALPPCAQLQRRLNDLCWLHLASARNSGANWPCYTLRAPQATRPLEPTRSG